MSIHIIIIHNRYEAGWRRDTVPVWKQQGKIYPCSTLPVGMIFPPFFLFISCVVNNNNMSLIPLIWWKFLIFLPWKLKNNTEWSLKCACHSAAFSGTECLLKGHWTVPEIRISVNIPWAFSGHSEMFQLTERRIFILCMR